VEETEEEIIEETEEEIIEEKPEEGITLPEEEEEEIIEEEVGEEEVEEEEVEEVEEGVVEEEIVEETPEAVEEAIEEPTEEVTEEAEPAEEEPLLSPNETGFIVSGVVSKDNDFLYELSEGQSAKIVPGSIRVDGAEIDSSNLVLEIIDEEVVVSTDFSIIEEGFGEEYLGEEIFSFSFSLEEFGFIAEEDSSLVVEFFFEGVKLFDDEERILSEGEEIIVNETIEIDNETITNETIVNVTVGNVTNVSAYGAVLGQPVEWIESIPVSGSGSLIVEIPASAGKIKVDKVDKSGKKNRVRDDEAGDFSAEDDEVIEEDVLLAPVADVSIIETVTADSVPVGASAEEKQDVPIAVNVNDDLVVVSYETPAPEVAKEEITEFGKRVSISSPDDVHYENVLLYTNWEDSWGVIGGIRVRVRWVEGDVDLEIESLGDDINGDGIPEVAWVAPTLSNQTFEIIVIIKAEHLDSNRSFISDIFEEVRELDGNWSETISNGEYVRVVFEIPLDNTRDITVYPRAVNGTPRIEVYEFEGAELIAEFVNLTNEEYNKVYLTNLIGEQDTFDLLILNGSLEFDHIVDPTQEFFDTCDDLTQWSNPSGGWGIFSGKCRNVNTGGVEEDLILLTAIDLTGKAWANFSFNMNNAGLETEDYLRVYVNSSAETWQLLLDTSSNAVEFHSFNITENITMTTGVHVRFAALSNDNNDKIFLDNINISYVETGVGVTECTELNLSNTVYTLQNDVNTIGTCFTITNDNITLDGNGFSVTGDRTSGTQGVYATGRLNLTIKNMNITNFSVGILFDGGVNNSLVENNTVNNNSGNGIRLRSSSNNNQLTNNIVNSNGNHGVLLSDSSNNNQLTNNIVNSNNNQGIFLSVSSNNQLTNNLANNNVGNGIRLQASSNNNQLTNNIANSNNNLGISISSSSNNNQLTNNIANSNNNQGIFILSSSNNQLTNNTANNNSQDGIRLQTSSNNTLQNNTLNFNIQRGLYFTIANDNIIGGGIINNSGQDAIFITNSSNNNFTNITITNTNVSFYDINFATAGINGTYLIDMPYIGNYSFNESIVYFKDSEFGEIRFLEEINGSGTNLTNDVRISDNSVIVESGVNSGLNKSANITLYGIGDRGFAVPVILRDGFPCPAGVCSNFTSLADDIVKFNVSYWTEYGVGGGCGVLGEANKVYTLQNDIITNETCFTITADNVTLDGNGKTVTGDRTSGTYGVYATGRLNLTIKNMNITNFSRGVFFDGGVNNSLVENNTVNNNSQNGIRLHSSSNNNLTNNIVNGNDNQGIYIFASSTNNQLINNIANSNNDQGIFILSSSNNNQLINNIANSNNDQGIFILSSSNNNLTNNIASNNSQNGIFLQSGSNNQLTNNIASNNSQNGIRLQSGSNNQLTNNIVNGNDNHGILILISSNNILQNNILNFNIQRGLYFDIANDNIISGGIINNSGQDAIFIKGTGSTNNNFTNVTITNTNASYYDINFTTEGINGTYLIDMPHIGNYSFTGTGGIVNFKDSQYGEIRFLETINGSGTNLTNDVRIGNNSVVESGNNVGLNRSANITLFGIGDRGFVEPVLLRDGVPCASGVCSNFTSLADDIVKFNVSYWTEYRVGGGCGVLNSPNTVYILQNDVSSSGTCFTIGADNVTLDGNGKLVNYSQVSVGYAVNNTGFDNVTIKNLVIEQGNSSNIRSYGVYYEGADDGTIENNTIRTSGNFSYVIRFDFNSNNNTITLNNITASGSSGYGIFLTANSISNTLTSNTINTNGSFGHGIRLQSSSNSNNNITNNTIIPDPNIIRQVSSRPIYRLQESNLPVL